MGCGSSKAVAAPALAVKPEQIMVATSNAPELEVVVSPPPSAPKGGGKSRGKGKGKGKGVGKGQGKGRARMAGRFQIKLAGEWKDYEPEEDFVLKKAFLVGQPNCRFHLRGQDYEYSFQGMQQKNLGTGKGRDIRPPHGMRPPPAPLLPAGPMVVITVPKNSAGKEIEIDEPSNKGNKIRVNVPPGAKAGQKMAVPVPRPGESVEAVQEKQRVHSAGAKLAAGVAGIVAVGGLAVGGVVLGDHLTGGDLGAADAAADTAEAVADWTEGGAEDVADWTAGAAEDVSEWVEGAWEDTSEWATGAAEDVADWTEGAWEDAVDWFEGAGEDIADFVTDIF